MSRLPMYEIEISHPGLNKYRHIRGSDLYVVQQKAAAQERTWDEMWEKKQETERKRKEREDAIRSKEQKIELAATRTAEAEAAIQGLEATLEHTLSIDDSIDWSSLLSTQDFGTEKPEKATPKIVPREPNHQDEKYQPTLGFLDKIFSSGRRKKEEACDELFRSDHLAWLQAKDRAEEMNRKNESLHAKALAQWLKDKQAYLENQKASNEQVLKKKEQYLQGEPEAILDYCEMVLANSQYPEYFPQEWDLDYQAEGKLLVVDYSLPDIDTLPRTKAVKYIASRDDFSESTISDSVLNKLYDSLLYQIALRTIHELYEADKVDALESIVFNGWVNSINKATGQQENTCIMSLQASKGEFLAINLAHVDPKACFRQLKGVGSSKLHGLAAVAPIISIDKEDRRFISAYAVAEDLDSSSNLAAMDWQDFENLIREVFEKEFASAGGEVKITQASRDGGVDAVAFDPDPIRGGKIVIQAKRYTNVVGVSAVRDLFGTTVNEGATKGILVTTADYGPDAYEFAKGKPLTLLNGGNLLHLLEKHGHKAKIDLKEAKQVLGAQKV